MKVLIGSSVREIVQQVNELNIKKESIVTLLQDKGQFFLIYYQYE